MLQLTTPGVYREAVFPTPLPALLTGVPAFLGEAMMKQPDPPQPLTLYSQFEAYYDATGFLARAVAGFFQNGGRRCFVVALPDDGRAAWLAGLAAIESFDVDLVCAPDLVTAPAERVRQIQRDILDHCQQAGDRFAILDARLESQIADMHQQAAELATLGFNGALYVPWLKIPDERDPGKTLAIPPCGHVAGTYARSDAAGGGGPIAR